MTNDNKRFSIRIKMYIFVTLTVFAVAAGTAMIAFNTSVNRINAYYKQCASDNAKNVAYFIDGDFLAELKAVVEEENFQKIRAKAAEDNDDALIKEYLREKGLWERFCSTRDYISAYMGNIKDMKYIYVVARDNEETAKDMYLISDDSSPLFKIGYCEEREEESQEMDLNDLSEPNISKGDWGWLCSDFEPVYDSKGECLCFVGCDFGMDDVMKARNRLRIYLVLGSLGFVAVVLTGAVLFINKLLIRPLGAMTREIKKFKPSEHLSYEEAGVIDLDIDRNDEIGEIYRCIRHMEIDTIDKLNDLYSLQADKLKAEADIKAQQQQIGQLSIETYKDALTGVGNKAAYIKKTEDFTAEYPKEFAIVMVEMNNLKRINDEYGHKSGDHYIKGCCRMICEAYKHSPVYRIGGDEFLVLLQGTDYQNRRSIFEQVKKVFEESYSHTEADPWDRFSAAVGMAEKASDDMTLDFVFKRADKAMYENKTEFKKKYGSYR
jgi:diguanylate cyclase (GGDEF)-like protein